jgi:hypothetical protein
MVMRRTVMVLSALSLLLISVNLVVGQQGKGGGKGRGFGGFGGFGGGGFGGTDPVSLVRNPQIRKELDISEEQLEKLPAAVNKALKEVLTEQQHGRLNQIQIQLKGIRAFTEADVQTRLKLTAEQKENIEMIIDDSDKERRELFGKGGFGGGGGAREKIEAMNKEAREKVEGVLTADQRKAFRQMTGPEFKMEFGGFGGGGGFGGKKKRDIQ